jgi:hypothetical protein
MEGEFYPADLAALRTAVEYVMGTGVYGDVVEFGCYRGRTAVTLAKAMHKGEASYRFSEVAHGIPERSLWVFDSFRGFPKTSTAVDAASPHIKAGVWYEGAPAGGSPAEIRSMCNAWLTDDRINVVAGWYKDTLSQIPAGHKFALVHVDCDYYESTIQVLDHLFAHDMIADGCTILFDDWYCNRGSPDFGEQKAWSETVEKYRPWITDWGAYGIVGRRFIVHSVAA